MSFLDAYVLELKDRPGRPICAVEKYIDGDYKKYNNNWNWSDEQRNTPQAFSHFSYEKSGRKLLICDIQGVGDLWTDPQIHSTNLDAYGKGNLGQEGIDKFLESHKCNEICRWLKLPPSAQVKHGWGGLPDPPGQAGFHVPGAQIKGILPAVQMKGVCAICRHPVFDDQARAKSQEGSYMHRTCLQTAAGPGLSAQATAPWRDNGRGSEAGLGRVEDGARDCAKADELQRGLVDHMLRENDH